MRVKQINYLEDETIKDITVTLSLNEAIAIVNIAGQLNGIAQKKLGLENTDSLYDALTSVLNNEYEDGAPDLGISLDTLNLTD